MLTKSLISGLQLTGWPQDSIHVKFLTNSWLQAFSLGNP